jgi:hypothetical protein
MVISRRSLILAPASMALSRGQEPIELIVGGLIVLLFKEVLKVALDELIVSAARYIWSNHIDPHRSNLSPVSYYVENGHAADNFCAYCTVEFARRSRVFWNGTVFEPNEENQFYRSRNKPTDSVLWEMLTDNDWLWHLDSSRNRNAHMSARVLSNLRTAVQRLEADKARLYYDILQARLAPDALREYVIDKATLDEIDKQYMHVTSSKPEDYHINPRYVDTVVALQKYATWFNTKLAAIDMANTKRDIFASARRVTIPTRS